jgi:alanine-glyoxylate transaminase / serine-glyoxylate transaminase / serine-pyruvate transaminase
MVSLTPPQRLLFGPGPSQVEQRVYDAMSQPAVGYLDPFLFQVNGEIRECLRQLFGTRNPLTFAISGTGSAGMETAISNFVDPGAKLLVFSAGYFGERLAEMGCRHGAQVARCLKVWGETFREDEAREAIQRERPDVVAFVHAETSTGALQPPRAIAGPAREAGALVIADCVTSLGAAPVEVDAAGIDVAYSCSQKGVSSLPGLAPFTASPAAFERLEAASSRPSGRDNPVWYLDLRLLSGYWDARRYHHTAPVSNLYALHESLAAILEEGLVQRFERHARVHGEFVRRIEAIGLRMHVAPGMRIPNLNTVRVPEGVDEAEVRRSLLEEHDIEIGAGIGPLAGKIFRIGLMGPLATDEGLDLLLPALEKALARAPVAA